MEDGQDRRGRPLISRLRDRVLGRRSPERDTAMSAIGTVGRMESALFTSEPLLADPPPATDPAAYVDTPWELHEK